jgi:hypothetical protein
MLKLNAFFIPVRALLAILRYSLECHKRQVIRDRRT